MAEAVEDGEIRGFGGRGHRKGVEWRGGLGLPYSEPPDTFSAPLLRSCA